MPVTVAVLPSHKVFPDHQVFGDFHLNDTLRERLHEEDYSYENLLLKAFIKVTGARKGQFLFIARDLMRENVTLVGARPKNKKTLPLGSTLKHISVCSVYQHLQRTMTHYANLLLLAGPFKEIQNISRKNEFDYKS